MKQPAEHAGHESHDPADHVRAVVKDAASSRKIYVREASGRLTRWRWACVWLTQLVYYGLPWLRWNGRPAVLFDLGARKFYLFGLVLWPQDFIYLAGLLILCAGLLFVLSAIGGRVWCGFGCPHSVYTEIFMWIERQIEGGRVARMRLDAQPLTLSKAARKLAKHAAWIGVATWTGITLVSYFTPVRILLGEFASSSLGPWESFWICCYGGLAYLNAGWMREQFCKYICAYARFQSVMFDRDTLIISYDRVRGEPRGLRRKNRDPMASPLGDCVDCTICVQVCPTGSDIRNGFQYECIDCGACADACDAVMEKIGLRRGLIRYSSINAQARGYSAAQLRRRILRPRVLAYGGLLAAGLAVYLGALAMRAPVRLDVIPDRTAAVREDSDAVANTYRLQVMNTEERARRLRITVSGLDAIAVVGQEEFTIAPNSSRILAVRVCAMPGAGRPGSRRVTFPLEAADSQALHVAESSIFRIPGTP